MTESGASAGPAPVATTWMWEARAASGRADELLAWLLDATVDTGLPTEVYRSTGQAADLVVAIVTLPADGPPPPVVLPEPPPELVARRPQGWAFDRVR